MTAPWPTDAASIRARVEQLWARVADAGGDPGGVRLLAVTKGFGPDLAVAAAAAGLVDLGENYAQELAAKAPVVAEAGFEAVRWHAIGRLQRNKVRSLAGVVALWQSVDRLDLGAEIAKRAPGAAVLVQVNVSDEPQKGGCAPGEAPELVARLGDLGLDVQGLMTVGRTGPAEAARAGFAELRSLADRLDLPVRSMGMSGDLEAAVAEGATMIRVGSALFGPRPPREPT
ncbi:YggS family pyridoxal phosphate-dependent enzyme [Aquihabitans sp. G128]|uniref:YggS family pyridoxal phosphate-dependent enzyme n=1 Tax=Aquihabitans sp. G128 TaxID=2849779 RepID=UPI001C224F06|nr:YggS family pyridoxal phosphate-dependent enzyme [Aquihabitans sp. G128]QXC62265.1 YggS family pyridoxal phosphate-dependent enzyme [Aquihabitans sp. G128]